MKKTTGLGQRLIERIRTMQGGIYADPDAKYGIRVTAWAMAHGYPPTHVFKWIGDAGRLHDDQGLPEGVESRHE